MKKVKITRRDSTGVTRMELGASPRQVELAIRVGAGRIVIV